MYILQSNFTHDLIYFTEIGVGIPPQRFQVLVDLSSPETFVSSVGCAKCYPGDVKYDSTLSSTSKANGSALEVDYGYIFASGNITADTFNFDDLQINNQLFLDATEVRPIGSSWDDLSTIHGVLGLTPSSAGSALNLPSPFMTMVAENTLDKNILSLRLQEPRELLFGAVNPKYFTGELVRLPLTNRSSLYVPDLLTGNWQAEAHYLALGDEPGVRMSLDGYTASFSTRSAFIFLPDYAAFALTRILGFEDIMMMPPSISCEQRAHLPDLTINLAGHNFTLTPYDYTFEWPIRQSKTRCVSAIAGVGIEQYDEIVLGSAFLRAFYSVFDQDTKTVGCKSAAYTIYCGR